MVTIEDIIKRKSGIPPLGMNGPTPVMDEEGNTLQAGLDPMPKVDKFTIEQERGRAVAPVVPTNPYGLSPGEYETARKYLTPAQMEAMYGDFDPGEENYMQRVYAASNKNPASEEELEKLEKQEKRRAMAALLTDTFANIAGAFTLSGGGIVEKIDKTFAEKNEERAREDERTRRQQEREHARGEMSAVERDYQNAIAKHASDVSGARHALELGINEERYKNQVADAKEEKTYRRGQEKIKETNRKAESDRDHGLKEKVTNAQVEQIKANTISTNAKTAEFSRTGGVKATPDGKGYTVRVNPPRAVPGALVDINGSQYVDVTFSRQEMDSYARAALADEKISVLPGVQELVYKLEREKSLSEQERAYLAKLYYEANFPYDRYGGKNIDTTPHAPNTTGAGTRSSGGDRDILPGAAKGALKRQEDAGHFDKFKVRSL